jgi:thymidine phosphorylase
LFPADKKLYALRDTTATVDSIPLIAASIMSKKLAEGIDGLLLDVKTGNGAFMEKMVDAVKLARTMVGIGKKFNKKVVALITDMNQPLGEYIGNSLEIYQTIKILKNEGPKDITELVIFESAKMLQLAGDRKKFCFSKEKSWTTNYLR